MKKQTICITGASKGIGRALAIAFADGTYNLILNTHKDADALEQLKKEFLANHPTISIYTSVGDIGSPAYVKEFLSHGILEFGNIDILINNAGISYVGLLTDMTTEQWQRVIDTNLNSLFYTCREVIPSMVHQKSGKILNISSIWGQAGASCEVAYSASKGGVDAFTKALAKELAPSGIAVNALSCGVIDTSMNACFSQDEKDELAQEIPVGRFASPKEVALAAKNLLAMPNYVTGQILTIDGGFL